MELNPNYLGSYPQSLKNSLIAHPPDDDTT